MENQNQKSPVTSSPQKTKIDVLKEMLNAPSVAEQFQNALDRNSGQFIASVIDLYNNDNQLQACEPKKVVMEALKAAVLKLPINRALGFAYIVVYNNNVKQPNGSWEKVPTPTFVPGYKGYIQLAMRTGQYRTINADVVYDGELKSTNKLTGEISFDGERKSDTIVGYFCYFELLNGFSKTLYMTTKDMAAYAKQYAPSIKNPGKDKKTLSVEDLMALANKELVSGKVGWEGNFNDMALKTVIRRLLSKYGYLSIEMQNVMANDVEPDADRNKQITQNANSAELNVTDISFEEVGHTQSKDTEEGPGY